TLTNRFNHTGRREATLKIELSLPKLLFGNNFDELSIDDFDPVTKLLKSRLKDMGVMVWEKFLLNAPVSAIHYSKNIPLTDGSTPHYLISKINEANIKLSLDINQTDYRNDGHSYKWHANSYEVAFYDKIKDLEMAKKSEKRAVERDNALQLSLFDTFEKRKQLEVLRMEVRLNKRQKIKQLFRTLGIQSELTYKNLFSPSISQQVLLHYLDEVESKRLPLFDYKPTSPKSLLADLIINNSRLGLKKTVQLYGLKQIFNDITPRELRTMFSGYSQRSWYRLIAEAKTVKLPPSKSPLEVIREHLTNFEPLKLVDFQDTMLNNDKYN
ncbi:MAG: hypothetical protein US60_C0035G0001, partial [Microgenomates group bacterium GW2011_GWC1_37_8]